MILFSIFVYLSIEKCQLEDQGYCDFDNSKCYFGGSSQKQTDDSVPLSDLIDRPINDKSKNNQCRAPKLGDPEFEILIEPCYQKNNIVDDTQTRCPDIPIDYYTENLNEVYNTMGKSSESIGFVSGVPTEFQITHIGRAYVFDTKNTDDPNLYPGDNATRLSHYPFRVLPINDDGYKTLAMSTAKKANNYFTKLKNGSATPDDLPVWLNKNILNNKDFNEDIVVPWPQFTCPLEITITDNRSPNMDTKVKDELNIYFFNTLTNFNGFLQMTGAI